MDLLYKIFQFIRGDSLYILKRRGLKVGKNFFIARGSLIDPDCCWLITIGDNVSIGPRVYIMAHDGSPWRFVNYTKIGKVTIGNKVSIGAGTIILPGVTIGDEVVIGAASVISHDIPSRSVAIGVPAKVVCTIDDYINRVKNEMKIYPFFTADYTLGKRVSSAKKREMNELMKDRFGYIV